MSTKDLLLLGVGGVVAGGGFTDPTDLASLVLWLDDLASHFEDTAGTDACEDTDALAHWADSSGLNHDAVQPSLDGRRPTFEAAGLNGRHIVNFNDAVPEYIPVADTADLDSGSGFTFFFVIRPDVEGANRTVAAKWTYSSDGGWAIQTIAGAEFRMFVADSATDGGGNLMDTTDGNYAALTWYILEVVYDGTQANADRVKFYLNGTQLSTSVTGTIPTTLRNSASVMHLGNFDPVGLNRPWDGDIAAVVIFKEALSSGDRDDVRNFLNTRYSIF